MAGKKDFKPGLSGLIPTGGGADQEPAKTPGQADYSEKRATFIVRVDLLEKIDAMAYWERTKLKDQINAALEAHIKAYEKANGPLQLPPKK